jgi:hypothetical protein
MSELARPELAWSLLLHLSSAGGAQTPCSLAAGLHSMTQLPVDRFVDPSEDSADVIDRARAEGLIQRAATALHDARTEVESVRPWWDRVVVWS